VIGCLPSKCKALSSNPNTAKITAIVIVLMDHGNKSLENNNRNPLLDVSTYMLKANCSRIIGDNFIIIPKLDVKGTAFSQNCS
jgi:hypothetical protein